MKYFPSFMFCSVVIAALSMPVMAATAERPDHFKGKAAATVSEATANFTAYNSELTKLLAEPTLSPTQLLKIHEITYTLENALAKLPKEAAVLAETLEALHLASEQANVTDTKKHGADYLALLAQFKTN